MMTIIQQLHFIRPEFFWLLPLALTAIFSLHLLRSKSSQWYDVIDPLLIEHLLDNPANNQASRRSSLPLFAAALACCIAIIAMAGPSWEKLPNVTEQKTDAMIIIADLTLSMHATDVKPSRLVRTRYKLLELLKQRKAGQTALIAYSGDAHVVSPLTDDASTIAALIPSLSPDIMPSIGSNAVAAFNSATQLLKNSGISRAKIVWFTDEALPSDINAIDNILNSKSNSSAMTGNHYQLMIIGIGSKAGGPIPLPSGKFIKDTSGRIVNAPLSRGRLKDIAANAGGVYFDLQSDNSDINAILSESLFDQIKNENKKKNNANTPQQQNAPSITDSWRDRGAYIALLLLPFALLAFRRGWILGLMLTINISYTDNASADVGESIEDNSDADTFQWIDLWQTADQQAYALERQQQHEQAAKQFENPEWKGVAEYQAGNYEDALQTLSALADKNDNDTSHYNHGHALARNNDLAGAIAAYDKALAINPDMENAKLAKSIVEALQQQQEQQQQDGEEGEEGEKGEKGEKNNEQQSSDQQESSDSENSESSSDESDSSQQGSESDSEASNELLDRQAEQAQDQTQEQDTEEEQQSQQQKNQQAADEQSEEEAAAAASKQAAEAKENTEGEAASLEAIEEQLNAEQQAQLEQWLKKIPDDPGGLLRRKFQYERSVRERQGNVVDDREQGQLW